MQIKGPVWVHAALTRRILYVVFCGAQEQVGRIDARRVVATMANMHAWRHRPHKKPVRYPVGQLPVQPAIPERMAPPFKFPAAGLCYDVIHGGVIA